MPQAPEGHGCHQVHIGPARALTVSAQRDVQIIPQPGGEADMPAPPEIAWVGRKIRIPEVHHDIESHELSESTSHITIGGKVAKDLQGKSVDPQHHGAGTPLDAAGEHLVGDPGDIVPDDHLLEEPPEKEPGSGLNIRPGDDALMGHLGKQVGGPFNRPGHQLGEQGNKEGIIQKALGRDQLSAIHVDGVAHGLEGIERDAHRQDNVEVKVSRTEPHRHQQGFRAAHKEIEVFKEPEDAEVDHHADGEEGLSGPLFRMAVNGLRHKKVHRGRNGDERQKAPIPASIKEIARSQKQQVLSAMWQQHIGAIYHRKKYGKI